MIAVHAPPREVDVDAVEGTDLRLALRRTPWSGRRPEPPAAPGSGCTWVTGVAVRSRGRHGRSPVLPACEGGSAGSSPADLPSVTSLVTPALARIGTFGASSLVEARASPAPRRATPQTRSSGVLAAAGAGCRRTPGRAAGGRTSRTAGSGEGRQSPVSAARSIAAHSARSLRSVASSSPRRGSSAAPRRCPGRPAAAGAGPRRAAATAPARRTASGTAPWPRTARRRAAGLVVDDAHPRRRARRRAGRRSRAGRSPSSSVVST